MEQGLAVRTSTESDLVNGHRAAQELLCWSPGFSLQVGDLSPLGNAILASVPECCPKDMFGFLCARLLVLE